MAADLPWLKSDLILLILRSFCIYIHAQFQSESRAIRGVYLLLNSNASSALQGCYLTVRSSGLSRPSLLLFLPANLAFPPSVPQHGESHWDSFLKRSGQLQKLLQPVDTRTSGLHKLVHRLQHQLTIAKSGKTKETAIKYLALEKG